MIVKSKGIVFNYIKYSETSIITTIYTDKYGRLSFIVNGARTAKGKIKANIFQSLVLLDFEFYYNKTQNIQRIKDIQVIYPFESIPFNVYKCSISLFIAEILDKSIKEEEANVELFNFISNSIHLLDSSETNFSNFHLNFLIDLSKYLGFYPQNNYSKYNKYFNIKDGIFISNFSSDLNCLDEELSRYLYNFITSNENTIVLNQYKRNKIIDSILTYYYYHLDGIKDIKSLNVLNEVFDDN